MPFTHVQTGRKGNEYRIVPPVIAQMLTLPDNAIYGEVGEKIDLETFHVGLGEKMNGIGTGNTPPIGVDGHIQLIEMHIETGAQRCELAAQRVCRCELLGICPGNSQDREENAKEPQHVRRNPA
jgi:hypothetical protein